ncbi:MAG: hypothetical protein II026_07980 [Bacteroidales bacterium]|nr:hypothetical protein [Bacteroidales bacterium]MBQ1708988.1 hypothetical protein [Bacteroidales bacterium]
MKKVLFALILAGGIFAMSSCAKECDCTVKVNDQVISKDVMTLEDGESCSDYNNYKSLFGISGEVSCTPQLF